MKMLAGLLLSVALLFGCSKAEPEVEDVQPIEISQFNQAEVTELAKSTVRITGYRLGDSMWMGSGVIISHGGNNSRILTARHVAVGADFLIVESPEGDHILARTLKFGLGPDDDWALLCVDRAIGKVANIVNKDQELPVGMPVCAYGHAVGLKDPTFTFGHLQESKSAGRGLLRISAPIIFGNSGGGAYVKLGGKMVLFSLTVAGYAPARAIVPHMAICYDVREILREKHLED